MAVMVPDADDEVIAKLICNDVFVVVVLDSPSLSLDDVLNRGVLGSEESSLFSDDDGLVDVFDESRVFFRVLCVFGAA